MLELGVTAFVICTVAVIVIGVADDLSMGKFSFIRFIKERLRGG